MTPEVEGPGREPPTLAMRGITKRFPGVVALQGVDFSARAGEIHALMGENGAGKSTLMKVLSGVYRPDEGTTLLEGQNVHLGGPRAAQQHGIAIIHQDLQHVSELSVAENFFLGREVRGPLGQLGVKFMRAQTRRWLGELGLDLDPARPVRSLRIAERQLLDIAKALSMNARVLIMDEPTSALNPREVERLFAVVRALRAAGVAVVYISHRLDEVFALADHVTVLRDGRLVASRPIGELDQGALIKLMVGRDLADLFPTSPHSPGGEVLRTEELGLLGGRRPLEDINLSVRAGEVVGLAGLLGAGRTELLETLFGAAHVSRVRGRMFLNGRPVRFASPREAIRAGLGFVTEDRKGQSLIGVRSVRENTSLAGLGRFTRGPWLDLAAENVAVGGFVRDLRVKTPSLDARVGQLSGGNQQKVVLAKFLLAGPKVILLDEPTQGVDVGAKAEIYALIDRLALGGAAVLLASSEMPELLALCDRILVMCEGRLAGELTRADASQERILELATRFQPASGPRAALAG